MIGDTTTEPTLRDSQSRILGALTLAAVQRLGGDTFMVEEDNGVRKLRMARINDIVLLDHAAGHSRPRSINCYLVEVEDFTAAAVGGEGKKFKIDLQPLAVLGTVAAQRRAARFPSGAGARSGDLVRLRRDHVAPCSGS